MAGPPVARDPRGDRLRRRADIGGRFVQPAFDGYDQVVVDAERGASAGQVDGVDVVRPLMSYRSVENVSCARHRTALAFGAPSRNLPALLATSPARHPSDLSAPALERRMPRS
jgi:hypothetical protein